MKRHATALRAFTHAKDDFDHNHVFLNMDGGQFDDWSSAGLVREATDNESARARGEPATKPAINPRRAKKPAGNAPVPAPDAGQMVAVQSDANA